MELRLLNSEDAAAYHELRLRSLREHPEAFSSSAEVVLAVTVGNEGARKLYLDAGFTPYSVEPRYIKVDDTRYDIEWMSLRL